MNENKTSALAGFEWGQGIPPKGVLLKDQYCVRKALCLLMQWPPDSQEWRDIPPGPPGNALQRLVEEKPELGLEVYDKGEMPSELETKGIVIGWQKQPIDNVLHEVMHAEYGNLRYVMKQFLDDHPRAFVVKKA
jgi:hypothetical protein